jgi:hypothetical protein
MLEKIAAVGSNRRRTERLPALKQQHMPSSSLSLHASTNPVRASWLARTSANREFFARFLLDTPYPFQRRSTRHSDTSRNGRKFSRCIKSARATRHLNATLVTRHSNAKSPPLLRSLFFPSAPQIRSAFVFFPAVVARGCLRSSFANPASSALSPQRGGLTHISLKWVSPEFEAKQFNREGLVAQTLTKTAWTNMTQNRCGKRHASGPAVRPLVSFR